MRGIKKYLAVTVMSAALLVLSPWPPAKGYEICDPYKTVGSIGDPCTPHNLLKDEIDLAGEKTKFSVQIAVARRKYFDAYPNGPGLAKAAADFSNLLFQKDAYYLYLVLMQEGVSRDAKVPLIEKVRALDKILGIVQIDGGIHRAAIPEFTDWAETFLAKLDEAGPTSNTLEFAQRFPQALADSQAAYQRYRLARDWGEFAAAGRNMTNDPKVYVKTLLLMASGSKDPRAGNDPKRAEEMYSNLSELFGEKSLLGVMRKVMDEPKDEIGNLTPVVLNGMRFDSPLTVATAILAESSDRSYCAFIFLYKFGTGKGAIAEYRRTIAAYGDDAVMRAAGAVHNSTANVPVRTEKEEELYGATPSAYGTLQRTLEKNNPKGYVRSILAIHEKLTTASAVDAAYSKLTSTYGEQKVLSAGSALLGLWATSFHRGAPYDDDYRKLTGTLDGSYVVPQVSQADLVDDPVYLAWKNAQPGSMVTHASADWLVRDGHVLPVSDAAILFETRKLLSINPDSILVEISSRRKFPSAKCYNGQRVMPECWSDTHDYSQGYPARLARHPAPAEPAGLISEKTSSETVLLDGRQISCQVVTQKFSWGTKTVWMSHQVPGNLVQQRTEKNEFGGVHVSTVAFIAPIADLSAIHAVPAIVFPGESAAVVGAPGAPGTVVAPGSTSIATPSVQPARGGMRTETGTAHPVGSGSAAAPASVPGLLAGTRLAVLTIDPIDLAGIDAGRRFRAQLQYPVQSHGKVILPEGTDVFLKATLRQLPGASNPNIAQIAITVDYVSMDNKHIPIAANEFFRSLHINAVDTFRSRSYPNHLQDRQVMPQTRLSFLALSEATN